MERPFPLIPGVEHHFVQAGEIRMHYVEAGDPAAEPLVLVHGWPQNHYAWRRVIGKVAKRFRVIAPDLRGFGWSDAPRSSYRKQEMADDVLALLDALELERVRLAGHDWGGLASFLLALAAPERVSALRTFAISHPWSPTAPRPLDLLALPYQPLLATPFLGPLVQRRTPFVSGVFRISGGDRIWSREERHVFADQFREPDRAEAASRVYRSFLTRELAEAAPKERLTVPTRLVVGTKDPVLHPGRVAGFEDHADDMTVEFVDGLGHWLPDEAPKLVADRILAD
jgi:pimeloyl-ACP methyl ester carboxylesterase